MSLRPRPEIAALEPPLHGGTVDGEHGRVPVDGHLADFSVSVNPLGPPPGILDGLLTDDLARRYPDPGAGQLRAALAELHHVHPDAILPGSGSSDLLRLVATAWLGRGDRALVAGPTYGEYVPAIKIAGAQALEVVAEESRRFRLSPDDLLAAVRDTEAKALFLCNPNNPTGQYLGADAIRWLLSRLPDTLLVLDEAYVHFAEGAWESAPLLGDGNLLVIRSMTKDYGLAGLRLGYAMAALPLLDPVRRVAVPWSVNAVALEAGMRCLALGPEVLVQARDYVRRGSEVLQAGFQALGFETVPTQAHFFLVHVGDGRAFHLRLLREGLVVRDCASFGLPAYVRVAPQRNEENERLLAAVGRLVKG